MVDFPKTGHIIIVKDLRKEIINTLKELDKGTCIFNNRAYCACVVCEHAQHF